MLSLSRTVDPFADLRDSEFSRLDAQNIAYLDYAASVGALRLSLGLPTNESDIDRAIALAAEFARWPARFVPGVRPQPISNALN